MLLAPSLSIPHSSLHPSPSCLLALSRHTQERDPMAALTITHLFSITPHFACLAPSRSSTPSRPILLPNCILTCPSSFSLTSSITPRRICHASALRASSSQYPHPQRPDDHVYDPKNVDSGLLEHAILATAVALTPMLLDCQAAWAGNGEYGILEGRSASLIHPLIMGSLFLYTLWVGYLGWQWRRVRTIQDEINILKKEVKPKEEGAPPSPVETKIKELTEIRKELLKGGYRDRHWNAGSILLAFGVFEAIGGCLNTWFRTGKLFPGPHLFAGAAITVLWALAAALVPPMQKGSETARSLHIGINAVNVVLFLWQIPTGWDIVLKVLQFTTWP